MRYANKTTVASEKSRAEIERTLTRYGATQFAYVTATTGAMIAFQAHGRMIRMQVPLPDPVKFERSPAGRRWPKERGLQAWEQAGRQRWRALALVVKAKLEAVESGVATFESEFLPYTLIPGTKHTMAEEMLPKLAEAYKTGKVPQLLIGD